MLAGLLFAIEEATLPAGRLVATLPFAGTTLIEHQARQLAGAGAAQIVVIGDVARPDLAGALQRIRRRGLAVDPVRGVAAAAALIHPLSRLVMLADGLVVADASVAALAAEGGEALLAVPGGDAPASFERIGGGAAWAGVARLDPARVGEAAALPADYAPQSTLLRLAEAAGAARIALPRDAMAEGHGIERDAAALAQSGRRLIAAAVAPRAGWFDRAVVAPLARAALPSLAEAGVSGVVAAGMAGGVTIASAAALIAGWPATGMVLAVAATLACPPAAALAMLRDERRLAAVTGAGVLVVPALAVLLLGDRQAATAGDAVPRVLAIGLVVAAALGARAIRSPGRWWGSPPAYLLVAAAAVVAGWPTLGLALAATYAALTLAAAIEEAREEARARDA